MAHLDLGRLLASRALPGVKRVMLGNGFSCPPDGDPSPLFPNCRPEDEDELRQREARLRTTGARAVAALGEAVDAALATITAADCEGYFRHCGYTLHLQ